MKVTLFIPCFIDQCYPDVGIAMVEILERLGHQVEFKEKIACCGQPAFNSGYWDEARQVAAPVVEELADAEVVVVASGSCGAMLRVFYQELFHGTAEEAAVTALSPKVYEFSQFLVDKLGVTELGAKFHAKVTYHDGCHGLRELGVQDQPRQLLATVEGIELVEMDKSQECCGFGGTFAAKFPMISTAMGEVKCDSALGTGADYIVSSDSSCLMHVQGLIDRQQHPIKTIHLATILNSKA